MYKKKTILFVLLCLLGAGAFTQTLPEYTQYMLNKYLINPAVAGSNGYTSFNLTARDMMGLSDAPGTYAICAQTRLLENSPIMKSRIIRRKSKPASRRGRVGLGMYIYNDQNATESRTGCQFSYAYHINVSNESQLSFGLSLACFQYKLDLRNAVVVDGDDGIAAQGLQRYFVPDANFGVYYTTSDYYAGFSVAQLYGSVFKKGEDRGVTIPTNRHYYLLGGYHFRINKDFNMEPCVLFTLTNYKKKMDLSTKVYYKDNYWMGISYRTLETMSMMAGCRVDRYYFGYAYDFTMNRINQYSSGTHELMIGVRIGDNNIRRYRWLRKDIRSFDQ